MRYTSNTRFSLRSNLIALVFMSLLFIAFGSWLCLRIIAYFKIRIFQVHDIIWLLLISAVVGSVVTVFLQFWVFRPISRLGKAMEQVAEGNFDIQLEGGKYFREIEDIYRNFNSMTRELRSSEILKTDFISNVSHEFKTPINAIEGYATLIQGGDREESEMYAEKILLNTGRLSKLVGNILLLSKVDNQAIWADSRSFRLDEQIRQAILQHENGWSEKELELEVELERLSYTGPEAITFHIWSNLIGNAVKFSPTGGRLCVGLKKEGEKIVFSVSDEGCGVSAEAAGHIFDKFYQADSSHKQEGNGLGLPLVKQITGLLGGSVSFENLPEKGCRFTVTL